MKKMLYDLAGDFMKSTKKIKAMFVILILLCATLLIIAGCQAGPSPDFAKNMKTLSDNNLQYYKDAVRLAGRSQLEILLGKEKGSYEKVSEDAFARLKNQIVREIESYIFDINENYRIAKGDN